MIKKLGFTVKKKVLHPTEKRSDRVQKLRVDYWKEIEGIDPFDLIFLDESGVNLGLTRIYGRMWSKSPWK